MKKLLFLFALCFSLVACDRSSDDITPIIENSIENIVPVVASKTTITADGFIASWNKIEGSDKYELQVSANINFTEILDDYNNAETEDTVYTVTGIEEAATYYYRVRGKNATTFSKYSEPKEIQVTLSETPVDSECFFPEWYNLDKHLNGNEFNGIDLLEKELFCKTLVNKEYAYAPFFNFAKIEESLHQEVSGAGWPYTKGQNKGYYHEIKLWYSEEDGENGSKYDWSLSFYNPEGEVIDVKFGIWSVIDVKFGNVETPRLVLYWDNGERAGSYLKVNIISEDLIELIDTEPNNINIDNSHDYVVE